MKTEIEWMDKLLPEGFPIKTSTIITGPGGSGKPLIGESFLSAWLRNGGSAAFLSLQYPSKDFISESLKTVTGIDLSEYEDKILFFHLDVSADNIIKVNDREYKVNLVLPQLWEKTLKTAEENLEDSGPGILYFGSALNLLLFSPTYGDAILEKIKKTVAEEKTHTYIFSVSTTAKAEEIAKLEAMADNLITTRSEKEPFRLYMKILRMKGVPFSDEEIQVPIDPKSLSHVKKVADHSRSRVIPAISEL
jgi:KaiC/GvpD/RAD55 family RecA-like ATPase